MGFTETLCLATFSYHGPKFLVVLFQGLYIRRHGVIVLRGGSGCGGTWGIFEGGSIVFSERGGGFISCTLCRSFRCSGNHSVFFYEVLHYIGPASVATFLLFLHHRVFKDIGLVNARDKLRQFIVVGDLDVVLRGVVLPPCEVSCVGAEMLVKGGTPEGVAILSVFVMTGQV